MARRSGFLQTLVQAQREAEKTRLAQLRTVEKIQTQAAKEAERAKKAYERAVATDQKERARLYTESQIAQAQVLNEQVAQQLFSLEHLLVDALPVDTFIHMESLKKVPNFPTFQPGCMNSL